MILQRKGSSYFFIFQTDDAAGKTGGIHSFDVGCPLGLDELAKIEGIGFLNEIDLICHFNI
jgi:hypothetical protein